MTSRKSKAILASARVANLPSVVSNVGLGSSLGYIMTPFKDQKTDNILVDFALLSTAGVLLCICGNLLNDFHDREWDSKHRPERALPTGLFQPKSFLLSAIICGLVGIFLAFIASPRSGGIAVFIASSILIYTVWHKRSVWTVLPMALCRALLPVMAMLPLLDFPDETRTLALTPSMSIHIDGWLYESLALMVPFSALFLYLCGLTLHARNEALGIGHTGGGWMAKFTLMLSIPTMALFWVASSPWVAWFAMVPVGAWLAYSMTRHRKPLSTHVSALLAGIPLLDWVAVLPCFIIPFEGISWFAALLPPVAFVAGRWLQRIASAT
jgi:4-hydroxybenzoate polyprenyltransferase